MVPGLVDRRLGPALKHLVDSGTARFPLGTIGFTTLEQGIYSGIHDAEEVVIDTDEAWTRFWSRHTSHQITSKPIPVVNFDSEIVLAFFDGDKPTDGYAVSITQVQGVREEGSTFPTLVVDVEASTKPGFLDVLTQPYHIIKIPANDIPTVLFEREG